MLGAIKNLGHVLYRVWFYILVTVPIILFFPVLLLLTISEKTYHQFFWLARNLWARPILYGMGCLKDRAIEAAEGGRCSAKRGLKRL